MQKTEWMEMKSDQSNPAIMNSSFLFPSLWLLGEVMKRHRKGEESKEGNWQEQICSRHTLGELDKSGVALAWGGTDAQHGWTNNHSAVVRGVL